MAIKCPACQQSCGAKDVTAVKRMGWFNAKQCGHCNAWFRLQTPAAQLQLLGLLMLLIFSVLNILNISPDLRTQFSVAGFTGALLAFLCFLFGKQVSVIPPK